MGDRPQFKPSHPDCLPEDLPNWTGSAKTAPAIVRTDPRAALTVVHRNRKPLAKQEDRPEKSSFVLSPEEWKVAIELTARKVLNACFRQTGAETVMQDNLSEIDKQPDAFSILKEEAHGTRFQSAVNALPTVTPNERAREAWEQFQMWYARDMATLTRRIMQKKQQSEESEVPEQDKALRREGERLIGAYLEAVKQWHDEFIGSVQSSENIPLQTTEEIDAYTRALADGHIGRNYKNDVQAVTRVHQSPGAAYSVALSLNDQEIADGLSLSDLERFTGLQDADGNLATFYVLGLLKPRDGLQAGTTPYVRIDLDDLVAKTGLDPRSIKDRATARQKVYEYLQFGERARVIGQRSIPYYEKNTGKTLDTRIDAPLWRIGATQRPVQLGAFASLEIPRQVEITLTPLWVPLLTHPDLIQYLPFGELLASIPGQQPSGAWARVLGLALANFWRRHPRETVMRSMKPTRRELLLRYMPKKADPTNVLNSKNPSRALEHWRSALQILKERGFVADIGEAAHPNIEHLTQVESRQAWQDAWLNEEVAIWPGPKMQPPVQQCADKLPTKKPPRDLTSPKSKRSKKLSVS